MQVYGTLENGFHSIPFLIQLHVVELLCFSTHRNTSRIVQGGRPCFLLLNCEYAPSLP